MSALAQTPQQNTPEQAPAQESQSDNASYASQSEDGAGVGGAGGAPTCAEEAVDYLLTTPFGPDAAAAAQMLSVDQLVDVVNQLPPSNGAAVLEHLGTQATEVIDQVNEQVATLVVGGLQPSALLDLWDNATVWVQSWMTAALVKAWPVGTEAVIDGEITANLMAVCGLPAGAGLTVEAAVKHASAGVLELTLKERVEAGGEITSEGGGDGAIETGLGVKLKPGAAVTAVASYPIRNGNVMVDAARHLVAGDAHHALMTVAEQLNPVDYLKSIKAEGDFLPSIEGGLNVPNSLKDSWLGPLAEIGANAAVGGGGKVSAAVEVTQYSEPEPTGHREPIAAKLVIEGEVNSALSFAENIPGLTLPVPDGKYGGAGKLKYTVPVSRGDTDGSFACGDVQMEQVAAADVGAAHVEAGLQTSYEDTGDMTASLDGWVARMSGARIALDVGLEAAGKVAKRLEASGRLASIEGADGEPMFAKGIKPAFDAGIKAKLKYEAAVAKAPLQSFLTRLAEARGAVSAADFDRLTREVTDALQGKGIPETLEAGMLELLHGATQKLTLEIERNAGGSLGGAGNSIGLGGAIRTSEDLSDSVPEPTDLLDLLQNPVAA